MVGRPHVDILVFRLFCPCVCLLFASVLVCSRACVLLMQAAAEQLFLSKTFPAAPGGQL